LVLRTVATAAGGKLVFHIFAALAEFERAIIRERTLAGLRAARARGRTGGRPPALEAKDLAAARALLKGPRSPWPKLLSGQLLLVHMFIHAYTHRVMRSCFDTFMCSSAYDCLILCGFVAIGSLTHTTIHA
jgi:hypothetical protein